MQLTYLRAILHIFPFRAQRWIAHFLGVGLFSGHLCLAISVHRLVSSLPATLACWRGPAQGLTELLHCGPALSISATSSASLSFCKWFSSFCTLKNFKSKTEQIHAKNGRFSDHVNEFSKTHAFLIHISKHSIGFHIHEIYVPRRIVENLSLTLKDTRKNAHKHTQCLWTRTIYLLANYWHWHLWIHHVSFSYQHWMFVYLVIRWVSK